ncbi:hypothetical protein OG936_36410 [Streptomyces sp. NBC_00846]|uniref:hypothetical protein n=1 Tax=Streptomyces sp. NBC_00846 TaxID=2975849 RepID=UPI00386ED64D|nr:hypothetical protein OG936_36410 [Streptomyces sp. NBC_00846]
MARKTFALNKEPHVAEIGDDIELAARGDGRGLLDAYERLRDRYRNLGIDLQSGDLAGAPPHRLPSGSSASTGGRRVLVARIRN